jgi:hypothetical protein
MLSNPKFVLEDGKRNDLKPQLNDRINKIILLGNILIMCSHGHLKRKTLHIQNMARKAFIKPNQFPTLCLNHVCYLDDMQMLVKNIFNIIGVMNSKIKVNHT